jgi:hypothetical protein
LKVLKRKERKTWHPSYKRAAISGAIAGIHSEACAEMMNYHPRFERQRPSLSLRTLVAAIGGGIAGVVRENGEVRACQKAHLKLDAAQARLANMSAAELADVIGKDISAGSTMH